MPKNCAALIAQSVNRKKNKERKNKMIQEPEKPGKESERKYREEFTRLGQTVPLWTCRQLGFILYIESSIGNYSNKSRTAYM